MFKNRTILALIPARGGSKGIPKKNLQKIDGTPLVLHAAKAALSLSFIDRITVSTDSEEIASTVEEYGVEVPFRRPEELSGDYVADIDVLKHAHQFMEQYDKRIYDVILMLQPTSPTRRSIDVQAVVEKIVEENLDAVWTISATDSKMHPLKQLVIDGNYLRYYDEAGGNIIARQQLKPVYHRNGIAYALTRNCLRENSSLMTEKTGYIEIDYPIVNIDTELDLKWAEFLRSKS